MARTETAALRHLGVNALFLEPRMGGIETYVRRLVPAIVAARPRLRVSMFVNARGHELLRAESWWDAVEFVTHPLLGQRGTRAVTEAFVLGALADRRGCDVLHSVALTAPLRSRAASVVGIADVTWLRHAGAVPAWTRLLWRTLVTPGARRARRIITHSEAAKAEIAQALGVQNERIDVVPHGPGGDVTAAATPEAGLRERLRLGEGPIVLAVSALLPHKNVARLVEAMVDVRRNIPDAVLVVPANPTPLGASIARRAQELGVDSSIVFPGWVDAEDLEGLYRAAACFAFPSLREGFGLPVLEAMRRGVPVACSSESALPEVAGEAAEYFDPHRPAEIAEAVVRLLVDRARADELAQAGRARAERFTWGRAAEETLASYERALAA